MLFYELSILLALNSDQFLHCSTSIASVRLSKITVPVFQNRHCFSAGEKTKLTLSIQSMKEETRVKTVGLLTMLQFPEGP